MLLDMQQVLKPNAIITLDKLCKVQRLNLRTIAKALGIHHTEAWDLLVQMRRLNLVERALPNIAETASRSTWKITDAGQTARIMGVCA